MSDKFAPAAIAAQPTDAIEGGRDAKDGRSYAHAVVKDKNIES